MVNYIHKAPSEWERANVYALTIKVINTTITSVTECRWSNQFSLAAQSIISNAESKSLAKSFCGNVYLYCFLSANMGCHEWKTKKFEWALYDWYGSVNFHENSNLNAHLSLMKLFMRLSASLYCSWLRLDNVGDDDDTAKRLINLTPPRNCFLICCWIALLFLFCLMKGVGENKTEKCERSQVVAWKIEIEMTVIKWMLTFCDALINDRDLRSD